MRIGINALFQGHGGIVTYLNQLLSEWKSSGILTQHHVVIFASAETRNALRPDIIDSISLVHLPQSDQGVLVRLVVEQTQLVRYIEKYKLDVLLCPGNTLPFFTKTPCVLMFQNAAPFCPSVTPRSVGKRNWIRFFLLRQFMLYGAKKADKIVFISRYFQYIFTQYQPLSSDKIELNYRAHVPIAAVRDKNLENRLGIHKEYILCVSHLYPFKNLEQLILGFTQALREGKVSSHQLVIVGKEYLPGYATKLQNLVKSLGVDAENVLFTGARPHTEVLSLIAGCKTFIFSSTCENCPTALMEALSHGAPILCSNIGVMPEIAGDAALYFDPYSPDEIEKALNKILSDDELRVHLGNLARQQAEKFPSPREMADKTFSILEHVVNVQRRDHVR